MATLIGQSLGRYKILEQLGEGGMATVYKACDTRLERDVAVKIIRRGALPEEQLERILKRFEHEAKALARLTHPFIVPVVDYGEYKGSPYLVMPYLQGGTLKQKMGKPLPWQEAVRLLIPVAQALAYSHAHNIIHRDIKPSNILLTENNQPMLSDFGIAKILDLKDGQTLTTAGLGIGTPEYMSPEQGMGKPAGPAADIYSLAIVLYELLTGRKPFTADTPMEVVFKQVNDPIPNPVQYIPDLPDQVVKILQKATAKQPEDRFADMTLFAGALESLLAGTSLTEGQEQALAEQGPASPALNEDSTSTFEQIAPLDEYPPGLFAPDGSHAGWRRWGIITGGILLAAASIFLIIFLITGGKLAGLSTLTPTPTSTQLPTATLLSTGTVIPTEILTPTPEPPITYVVQNGDTCISIANLFHTSVISIITLNHLNSTCTNLPIGQTILIPPPTPTPEPTVTP
jgi:serine/threonine protein kinase